MLEIKQYSQSLVALGSTVTCCVSTTMDTKKVSTLFDMVWLKILQFEKKYSRFIESSELTRINKMSGKPTTIDNEFKALLMSAKNFALESEGLYNPFILPALQRVGYKRSFVEAYSHESTPDFSDRNVTNINSLEIFDDYVQIPQNSAIDLGGIGKGYIADNILEYLKTEQISGAWISVGGDVAGFGTDENGRNWKVEVQNADQPEASLFDYEVTEEFHIATSGTIIRKGVANSRSWHHVIDPKTLLPTKSDIQLATVQSTSTARAEIFAKVLLLVGSDNALEVAKKYKLQSVLIQYKKEASPQYLGYGELYESLMEYNGVHA